MIRPVGLAPYASKPEESRGRLYPEPEHATRSAFQRDRDRIIHSTAFRRLTHKTQVFVYHEGDHYRTRLTHSLEVAQIARTISRALGLDEDLAETLALAHDLGHTPFGHAGEEALNAEMARFGGFSHNDQTLRILTCLERRYAEFDGLNLTWESLEGTVKHNGPLRGAGIERPVPPTIAEYDSGHPLALDTFPSAEAQVAAIADDIAYNNHDVDDGLRAGLFAVADLADVPLVGPVFHGVASRYPGIEEPRLIHESIRRLIDRMVGDLIGETSRRLDHIAPGSVDEVRALNAPIVDFSDEMNDFVLFTACHDCTMLCTLNQPAEVQAYTIWFLAVNRQLHDAGGALLLTHFPDLKTAARSEQKRAGRWLLDEGRGASSEFKPSAVK